jgi:hypothetical protein
MFFMVLGAGDIESARNIFHYLAFWSFDIVGLQETLAFLGLSNPESYEAHTIATINLSPQSLLLHHPITVQDGLTSLGSKSTKQSSQWVVEVPRVGGRQQLCRMFVRSPNRQVTQCCNDSKAHSLSMQQCS